MDMTFLLPVAAAVVVSNGNIVSFSTSKLLLPGILLFFGVMRKMIPKIENVQNGLFSVHFLSRVCVFILWEPYLQENVIIVLAKPETTINKRAHLVHNNYGTNGNET